MVNLHSTNLSKQHEAVYLANVLHKCSQNITLPNQHTTSPSQHTTHTQKEEKRRRKKRYDIYDQQEMATNIWRQDGGGMNIIIILCTLTEDISVIIKYGLRVN